VLRLPQQEIDRIRTLLTRAGLPTHIRLTAGQRARLLAAMKLDKKVRGGEIRFVLAKRIGQVEFGQRVPMDLVEQALCQVPVNTGPEAQ
jgi:3-dehydroquinate synthetase